MTRKRWKGDKAHLIPAQQIEPYRLWFEFLKLARRDAGLKINEKVYRDWGNVSDLEFRDWWEANWRRLFAVDRGVNEITSLTKTATKSDKAIYVRIPLFQSKTQSLSQIEVLLEKYGVSDRLRDMAEGKYSFRIGRAGQKSTHPSTRFLRNLPKVRLLYHFYRFWLQHADKADRQRLEATARSYFNWADVWNTKVRTRKWKRTLIHCPAAVSNFVRYLDERGGRQRVWLRQSKVGDVSDDRRQIARYIRKGRAIAKNVAGGQFPGSYE